MTPLVHQVLDDSDSVIKRADDAFYEAKNKGQTVFVLAKETGDFKCLSN